MSQKQPVKENSYDTAQAGAGSMNYSVGWGTPASPNVSQDPSAFVGSKTLGSNSNTAASAPSSDSQYDAVVDQIYSKEVTPSVDEVMSGLKYELHQMTKKDKAKAKEIVLANLKKDPHFYGKLGMLNIDDKEMMKENKQLTSEQQMAERVKLLGQMIEAKGKKVETPKSYMDALAETRAKKAKRYTR